MKKTKQDPTGQAQNRARGDRTLRRRLVRAEREVRALFREVPRSARRQTKIRNEQTTVYDYTLSAEGLASLARSTEFIINDELLQTQTGIMPFDWYWKENIELPYRQGALEETRDFNQAVVAATAAGLLVGGMPPQPVAAEQVLLSDTYRAGLSRAQVTNFGTIKTLAERTASQVIQTVTSGIEAGVSPRTIAQNIAGRFDVAATSATRDSVTEVNKAYNDAKLDTVEVLGQRTGLRPAVIHISALITTTRPHHAARHGNAYTAADQREWWNTGANRINCHCTARSVLIDRAGNVMDTALQAEVEAERAFFAR
jgi:hypothetical protein